MSPRTTRAATAILLGAAAIGAVIRSANASVIGRIGGVSAAVILVVTGVAAWRGQRWAAGVAFLVALCWTWASLALVIQGAIGGAETAIWLTWSAVVIWASVTGRERDTSEARFPPMRTAVGEDEHDGS